MDALVYIATYCSHIAWFFKQAADYASYIPYAGDGLYSMFMNIGNWFYDGTDDFSPSQYCLYSRFMDFHSEISNIWDHIAEIVSWDTIQDLLEPIIEAASNALDWVKDAYNNVVSNVTTWWDLADNPIKVAIATVKKGLEDVDKIIDTALTTLKTAWGDFWDIIWPAFEKVFNTLATAWDTFIKVTLPTLATNLGAENLIDSTLKKWFPFYDDLVKIWGDIKQFFTDPLEFLWTKFADWFLGPE